MKEKHTCPKCSSKEVYTNSELMKRGDRCSLPITSWSWVYVDIYICLACGYVEEYITNKDLKNQDKMAKIKKEFKKII
jgi:predicted nucleic-acid-binding Zn-ribbon protein